jgi:Trypsin-like peptidase domain
MQRGLLSIVVLLAACSRVEAGCIDPATLVHSTVSITRYFDDNEKDAPFGPLGMSGTGWFLSPTSMVTVEHVAVSMKLSERNWKQLEIWTGQNKLSIPVRIQRLVGSGAERIALLELRTPFAGVGGFRLRKEPLVPDEPIVSFAYPDDHLRVTGGRFVRYGGDDRFTGMALLELYDGDDRLALDYGSSGAPVLDCSGRAVAVVSKLLVTTIQFMASVTRIPTAWGKPNVVSVPIDAVNNFSGAE